MFLGRVHSECHIHGGSRHYLLHRSFESLWELCSGQEQYVCSDSS